jgi:hypothetical protein
LPSACEPETPSSGGKTKSRVAANTPGI